MNIFKANLKLLGIYSTESMETDDDIFIIHKRVQTYIREVQSTNESLEASRKDLVTRMLSSPPPHGYTQDDWDKFQMEFGIFDLRPSSPSTSKLTYKECKDIIAECNKMQDMQQFNMNATFYDWASKEIINSYKASINNVIHTDFMTVNKRKDLSPEQKLLKDKLMETIESFFGQEVLEKVVKRKVIPQKTSFVDTNENAIPATVDELNTEGDEEWNGMVFNDINRINFNIKFKYDKRQHFKETINQYQGLQHKYIPPEVINDLIRELEEHGLADKTKTDPKERYAKLQKSHISMFLKETKHTGFYEDKQLIYSKITTLPCPNIQKYEKGLYADFEKLVEVFLELSEDVIDHRKNLLNTHYILRQLLKKRGIIVPEDDLNNLKTPARIRIHDDIYQMCCEKLGWKFTPLG